MAWGYHLAEEILQLVQHFLFVCLFVCVFILTQGMKSEKAQLILGLEKLLFSWTLDPQW